MKKKVLYDKRAEEELRQFNISVQQDFMAIMEVLQEEGKLEFPDARKVTKDIFEARIMKDGAYRGFYAYIYEDCIITLHFFHKKQQKIPRKHLRLAEKRLQKYV